MTIDVDQLLDRVIHHRVGLERYSAGLSKRIISVMEDVHKDLQSQIAANLALGVDSTRLKDLETMVKDVLAEGHKQVRGTLRDELVELAKHESSWGAAAMRGVGLDYDFISPSAQMLRSVVTSQPFQGQVLRDWAKGLEADSRRKVMQQLRIGILEGEATGTIAQRIRAITGQKQRHAEAMTRTAVNHVSNRAHYHFGHENPNVFTHFRWVSVLDSRTSPICRSRAGKVYVRDSQKVPPAHWQCRSTIIWLPLGTEIQSEPSYDEWLMRQDRSEVEEALGMTRAALFLDGKVSTRSMVNRFGRELTLDQLRSRDGRSFDRAGV